METYSEPCQTSNMERFAKVVNNVKLLTIFAKHSTLDVRLGHENAPGKLICTFHTLKSDFEIYTPFFYTLNEFNIENPVKKTK